MHSFFSTKQSKQSASIFIVIPQYNCVDRIHWWLNVTVIDAFGEPTLYNQEKDDDADQLM